MFNFCRKTAIAWLLLGVWLAATWWLWPTEGLGLDPDSDAEVFETYRQVMVKSAILAAFLVLVGFVAFRILKHQDDLRVAATAFNVQEGILVTNAKGVIVRVNDAFCEVTGYQAEEVIGKTPAILNSGRQDKDFYHAMWLELKNHGHWLGEIWNRKKSGEEYCERLSIHAVYNRKGQVSHYVGAFFDITKSKSDQAEIRRLAFFDPLTQLANRRLLIDRLEHALASSAQIRHYGALLYIDMDRFKALNDTKGHETGDKMLMQIADRLRANVREVDTVARFGGDEFVVLFEGLNQDKSKAAYEAEVLAEKIRSVLSEPYEFDQFEFVSTPSIGIALFVDHEDGAVDDILRKADSAMYQAKHSGRNTIRLFDPQMQASLEARLLLEEDLKKALDQQDLDVFYQPQVDAQGRLIGVEALTRWTHPQRGSISPAEFIPLAEESGLILQIGDFVLKHVAQTLSKWAESDKLSGLTIAMNISAHQLQQVDFVAQIAAFIKHYGFQPDRLKLELTESMMLIDIQDSIDKMQRLKALGVQFSMDDFGTGYSSLLSIKNLPLDQLKIDQNFVQDLFNDDSAEILITTILSMSKALGLSVVAEGVETQAHYQKLMQLGCKEFQGYYFAKPLPYPDLMHYFIDQNSH